MQATLKKLYTFYHNFLKGRGYACVPGCRICCTNNVVCTSLEAGLILKKNRDKVLSNLKTLNPSVIGYRPTISINESAAYCLRGEEPPEDKGIHSSKGHCLFLDKDNLCTVYPQRPFSCRAMTSTIQCTEGGEAEMDPFIITVNLAIHQILEHLDQGGVSGNMWEVLLHCLGKGNGKVVENMPLPGFLVPPHERGRFEAFLRRLKREVGVDLI